MSTLYLATPARDQIDAAQAMLDAHPGEVDGTCLVCGSRPGCGRREALRTLARYGRLPQRRPGASRPDQVHHDDQRDPFRWFRTT